MSLSVQIPHSPFDFIEAHPNVYQLILEYCISSIDDLKNIGLTNKAAYEKTWTHLMASVMGRNNMKLLLGNFGLPYTEFMRALRDSSAVISGSFALQAVMGDKASFSADDIDIYVSSNQNLDILNSFLEDNGYEFVERDVPPGVIALGEQLPWDDEHNIVYHMNPVFASLFKGVRDYKQTAGEGKVQIIEMQEGRLVTQASDMYDMTMVQVLMHPVPVTVTALNDEFVGVSRVLEMNDYISFEIKHPADIYNRRLKLNPQWITGMQTIQGLVSNRTPVNQMDRRTTHRCLEMVYARVQKYVARGFLFKGELPLTTHFRSYCKKDLDWTGDGRTCAYYMLQTSTASLSDEVIIEYFSRNPKLWYQPCRVEHLFSRTEMVFPLQLLCEHYRPKIIKKLLTDMPDLVHERRRKSDKAVHDYLPTVAEYTKTLVTAGIVDIQECLEKTLELEEIRAQLKSKVMATN